MRPAEQGAASAVYFTLRNPGSDTLVLQGVDIDVAGSATLHQSMDHDGMSSMMPLDSVMVLPGDSVAFAERGLHVMASELHTALALGDTVVIRLRFRGTRVDTLRVPVRE
jgi:periplasmic copper chaperone A